MSLMPSYMVISQQINMAQRPGFIDELNLDYVCLLHKSFYGLKQVPRA